MHELKSLNCLVFLLFAVSFEGVQTTLRGQNDEDHKAFLGKMKDVFDSLSLEEAKRRLRLLVPHIDIDKDGYVTEKELTIWVRDKYTSLLERDDTDGEFREADVDWNKEITWDEYVWRHYRFRANGTDDFTKMLKEEHVEYLSRDKRRWKHADIDEDGVLNLEEFHMFKKPDKYAEMADINAMEELEHADVDKDGYLSLEEYLKSIHMPYMRDLDEEKFHKYYDTDKDGRLNVKEVKIWKTPEIFDKAKREASHLIQMSDTNEDGYLTSEEIVLNHFIFVGSKATRSGTLLHDEF